MRSPRFRDGDKPLDKERHAGPLVRSARNSGDMDMGGVRCNGGDRRVLAIFARSPVAWVAGLTVTAPFLPNDYRAGGRRATLAQSPTIISIPHDERILVNRN